MNQLRMDNPTYDSSIKKQHMYFRKGEYYFVSPWRMLYIDDQYYLLALDSKDKKFKNFRVDKMEDVALVEESGISVLREGEDEFKK